MAGLGQGEAGVVGGGFLADGVQHLGEEGVLREEGQRRGRGLRGRCVRVRGGQGVVGRAEGVRDALKRGVGVPSQCLCPSLWFSSFLLFLLYSLIIYLQGALHRPINAHQVVFRREGGLRDQGGATQLQERGGGHWREESDSGGEKKEGKRDVQRIAWYRWWYIIYYMCRPC